MEFNFILTGLVLMLSFVTFSLSNRMNKYSNIYLTFLENYFSDKNAQPLKQGKELIKQIFG